MMGRLQESWQATTRGVDRIFDSISARPLGLIVFGASAFLLIQLQLAEGGGIRADAVAQARHVDHPARVDSFVTDVYVQAGDAVDVGTPLVELSSHFIDRRLARIDAEIEKLLRERHLAQARLVVDEQRWLNANMRMRPDQPSLEAPTEAVYASEIALMQTRRKQLLADREALTIKSSQIGRIVHISASGSAVSAGTSVASVTPEYAEEIVAYVPANTQPTSIRSGAQVQIARPITNLDCRGEALVLRRGGAVEEAPGQLRNFFRFPVHGMPVHISIPEGCRLGVGQIVTVEFPKAVM
jgi:multidrug resistance efflux pump